MIINLALYSQHPCNKGFIWTLFIIIKKMFSVACMLYGTDPKHIQLKKLIKRHPQLRINCIITNVRNIENIF